MAHSHAVLDAILKSPNLEHCRTRVKEADCEVLPKWANGANLLRAYLMGKRCQPPRRNTPQMKSFTQANVLPVHLPTARLHHQLGNYAMMYKYH